jgi:uncharacterized SAM-dependent methyltransferase
MTDEMSGNDPTKYEYIQNNFDIDDYILWLSFQSRKNKIEKHFIDDTKSSVSFDDIKNK